MKLKNFIQYLNRVRGANKSWEKRHNKVLEFHKEYAKPCNEQIEQDHKALWSGFRRNPDVTTLRICNNISGIASPFMIPEDIYVSDIEPSLLIDESVNYLSNKSFYNNWFPSGLFPKDYFHRINGEFYDVKLNRAKYSEIEKISQNIQFPVVLKPNRDSFGGDGIHFIKNQKQLVDQISMMQDFVVQEKIEQHECLKQFSTSSLNTVRAYIYRSVQDNQLHILSMSLRMGKDGSLDNETAGGIHTLINDDGNLNGFAVDKYGTRYDVHPNSLLPFEMKIPDFRKLKKICFEVASKVFLARIIGIDASLDDRGNWRMIEINTKGHAPRFAQYAGKPFFGEFTNEVIQFCSENHWALKS